jgi:hypothetical protein
MQNTHDLIDLGKTVFHLIGLNLLGEVVIRKKCSRTQLLQLTSNVQVDLIGMEACAGAHFLARPLREQGHEVRIIPAQYVKPYVKTAQVTRAISVIRPQAPVGKESPNVCQNPNSDQSYSVVTPCSTRGMPKGQKGSFLSWSEIARPDTARPQHVSLRPVSRFQLTN